MLSVKQGGIKYHFFGLWYRPGIEFRSLGPLVNTLTIIPIPLKSINHLEK